MEMPVADISPTLIQDLQAAMAGAQTKEPGIRISRGPVDCGSIYFGYFASKAFNADKDHFAMSKLLNCNGLQPTIPFAPITSGKHKAPHVLVLPAGTLPSKRMPDGSLKPVPSYVLLGWKIVVSRSQLVEKFRFVRKLPTELISKAKEIISSVQYP